jgi:hypothetical protein
VTRGKLLDAFEDMDYEQLQRRLSELQLKRSLFEINPETYFTTIDLPSIGYDSRAQGTGVHCMLLSTHARSGAFTCPLRGS